MDIRQDCLYYSGHKPCLHKNTCGGCPHYSPIKKNILIIKLGALGDVLRTTPVLRALQGPGVKITWLAERGSIPLLENNPYIQHISECTPDTLFKLQCVRYDLILNFDKDDMGCAAASLLNARKKMGFITNKYGTLDIANSLSAYALRLGLDDQLKFKANTRTYQDIIFEMAGLHFNGETYVFDLTAEEKKQSAGLKEKLRIKPSAKVIGINAGCGERYPMKRFSEKFMLELLKKLKKLNTPVVLLGGSAEDAFNRRLRSKCGSCLYPGYFPNPRDFAALVNICDLVITADTLAMHLAIALQKKLIACFGPTSITEVHMYDTGRKITASLPCSPCYSAECGKKISCMDSISVDLVYRSALEELRIKKP